MPGETLTEMRDEYPAPLPSLNCAGHRQRPLAQRVDDAAFRDRDELGGLNQAAGLVTPAQQGLKAGRRAGIRIHLRAGTSGRISPREAAADIVLELGAQRLLAAGATGKCSMRLRPACLAAYIAVSAF